MPLFFVLGIKFFHVCCELTFTTTDWHQRPFTISKRSIQSVSGLKMGIFAILSRKRILWMNGYCKMASGSGDKIDPGVTEITWKDERVWQ
jgi:hypothetical protein